MILELSPLGVSETVTGAAAWWTDGWWESPWWGTAGASVLAITLVASCVAAWFLNLVAMPGNWIVVALVALFAWLGPEEGRVSLHLGTVVAAFVLALSGEGVEFAAGAFGASRAGASRRATLYSIGGSVTGALLGAFIGLPVPLIGPILAAVLFGGLGATAGAIYAERTNGRPWRESWTIGRAAFVGRTLGTAGKSIIGLMIVLWVVVAVSV